MQRQDEQGRTGPLAGVRVVDLSRALAGPHAAMMLGDLGADVVKIESPDGGDDSRSYGPPFLEGTEGRESAYFLSCNRNKRSMALDLKSAEGKDVLSRLVRQADVLVENFRPGVLARLGFDVSVLHGLNPRLVILSISGFGHDGPEGGRPGYDQIAQGEAGLMSVTGPSPAEPQRVGVPIADLTAGMYGAFGILAALLERELTGRGQLVTTSLLAAVVGVHAFQGTNWTVAGQVAQPRGNHHPSIVPYGLFACQDGGVQVACGNEGIWQRLCAEFDLDPRAPGMESNLERVRNREAVTDLISSVFADLDVTSLLARLASAGVPAGRVRTIDDVYDWEQTRSQGLLIGVDHASLGPIELPGPPLRFFADSREVTPAAHTAPPLLDEHGDDVVAWLSRLEAADTVRGPH